MGNFSNCSCPINWASVPDKSGNYENLRVKHPRLPEFERGIKIKTASKVQGGRKVIVVTTEQIEVKRITETLGLVRGSTIRARHIGRDIMAGLRNVVGGEVKDYTVMLAQAREEAIQRMIEQAEKMGANAIIGNEVCDLDGSPRSC